MDVKLCRMILPSFISVHVGNLLCAQLAEVSDQFLESVPSDSQKHSLGKSDHFMLCVF